MKGSVYKRCKCPVEYDSRGRRKACRKPHGSWTFVADLGNDPATGKRRQVRKSGFATSDDAEDELSKLMASVADGSAAYDKRLTVAAYLRDWIGQKEFEGLRASTLRSYRQHIDQHIVPRIGRVRLGDLRGSAVAAMFRDIRDETGVKPATLQRIRATLRAALNDAVPELIAINPAAGVKIPSGDRPKVHPWEPAELGAFLDSATEDRLGPLFEVMALTGLRRGEACGLRWQDVDLPRRILVVRQQITEFTGNRQNCPTCGVQHGRMSFGPPKTSAGEDRVVDLDEHTVGVLLSAQLQQQAERDQWGDAYDDHGLVFAREDGGPLPPSRVSDTFGRIVDSAGLRRVRLHDLRHGQASLMLAAGVSMAVVSKRLGHSSIGITSDTYSHLLGGVGRDAAEKAAGLVPRDHNVTSHGGRRGNNASDAAVTCDDGGAGGT